MADLRARRFVQLGVVLALGLAATACSTMSDIGDSVASIDPTGLLGGDSSDSAPDLSNIPSAPANSTDQAQVASNVNAAGNQAQYSADALRAGTEAAAPPPSPSEAAPSPVQQALAAPAPVSAPPAAEPAPGAAPSADAPPSADSAPPSAAPVAAAPSPDAPPSADAAPSAAAPSVAPPSASSSNAAVPAVPPAAGAPVRTASAAPVAALPSGGEPAVPALAPGAAMRGGMTAPVMSDAALGFRPSAAPPLNPSINQWVSQPILNNYRRTASLNRVSSLNAAVPAAGGDMTPVSASGGLPATATVFFPGDGTALNTAGKAQVRAAVAAFKAQGSTGSLRVVGHASSRTANMPVEKHLELIFSKSQSRANAVAQELIHDGVPASQVIVEAVGDSQPVYYESMPKGEDGNRRAEIFLQ